MRDLIDREAVLNCFHCWMDKYGDVHTPDEMEEYNDIEALPSILYWTLVEEELPEKNGYYLISNETQTWVSLWDGEKWMSVTGLYSLSDVHAWMPLPEPYGGM